MGEANQSVDLLIFRPSSSHKIYADYVGLLCLLKQSRLFPTSGPLHLQILLFGTLSSSFPLFRLQLSRCLLNEPVPLHPVWSHPAVILSQVLSLSALNLLLCCCSVSRVQLFVTPWTTARQASLSFTISWILLKFMSTELVMPSNHLIRCLPVLLPSIFPSVRVFSSESAVHIR